MTFSKLPCVNQRHFGGKRDSRCHTTKLWWLFQWKKKNLANFYGEKRTMKLLVVFAFWEHGKNFKRNLASNLENLAYGFIKSPKLCKREKTKTQSQNDSQQLYKLENRKKITCRQWWRIGSQHLENPVNNVTVLEANLTRRQPREKLQCLYENLMSHNFCKTAFLKKKNELWTNASLLRILLKQNKLRALHVLEDLKSLLKFFTHFSVKISREKLQTNVENLKQASGKI